MSHLDNHIIHGKFFTRAISFKLETCKNVKAALDLDGHHEHRETQTPSSAQWMKFQVLVSVSVFFNLRKLSVSVATSLSSWYHSQPSTPLNRSQLGS